MSGITGAAVFGSLVITGLTAPAVSAAAPAETAVQVAASASTVIVPTLSATDQRLATYLTARALNPQLGTDLKALVTDTGSGTTLWSQGPTTGQLPASTTKLVTAVNTLQTFGPDYRFTTTVKRGAYWNRVVLVGSGDPGFTSAQLATLATKTAVAAVAHGYRWVTVYVDDSLFPAPSLAYGWKSTYVPADVSPVRALVVNQRRSLDTSIDAGKIFATMLSLHGVRTRAVVRGRAAASAPVIGSSVGRRVDSLLASMLLPSDNDYAEAFHRLVAKHNGYATTWAGAQTAQRKVLTGLGVDLSTAHLYDGSGLSRADRLTPAQLVSVLTLAVDGNHPRLAALPSLLPIAARTGTLAPDYLRYTTAPTSCAAGLIQAKTGSLSGVIALAGYARGADGRRKAFALLDNGVPATLTTRRAVDRLAATVTGCY
jgi:D-alanyl-D-alanine carboxypeptidase/D-alanyl-D-alanine-endopeptidase (penicillin-binding protein 4)